ncbi:(2E,6E)-farnesyl diphosphate synthase [Pseudoalteromonas sp. T1lg65]|uniref:(2E,6E)-farnesyl diphosphate synthase n=1 Tax=Pseudoalteromonas sp. T1lg65 TaxID=2077101 RepID=UPI003F7A1B6E
MTALLIKKLGLAKERVEHTIARYFEQQLDTDDQIKAATQYAISNGGKRLRPFLVYSTGELFGASQQDLDACAAAIECIHSYSLVHDDLPAMDDDELRRGKPTCHIMYDEATAILAGDALQSLAFELLSEPSDSLAIGSQLKMLNVLAKASGLQGMVGGQALDLDATDQQISLTELERIHRLKTGALLRCSVELGLLSAGRHPSEPEYQALVEYGNAVGLAFQVRDDILDIEGSTEVLGKPSGSDIDQNKSTYPALLGLPQAQAKAEHLIQIALNALDRVAADTQVLADLAKYIIDRDH